MNSKSIQNQQLLSRQEVLKKSYSVNSPLVKKSILAVDITSDKKANILEFIVKSIENSTNNYYITTPNPYNVDVVAEAIEKALIMPKDERLRQTRHMASVLEERNVYGWALRFLKSTVEAGEANQ